MKLCVGYKNYSSWSLRAWIAMRANGIAFEELFFPYAHDDTLNQFAAQHKTPPQVPQLIVGKQVIWDSLAIMEYLAETYPEKHFWPEDKQLRALARSTAAEMHSSFQAIRNDYPMNCRQQRRVEVSKDLQAVLHRLADLWDLFAAFPNKPAGEFLAGQFGAVDAMYAPIMWRVVNYGLTVSPAFDRWAKAMLALPAMQEWLAGAKAEADTYVLEHYHRGTLVE
ncbi:glutathione S-transferase [Thiofilum flexile]|uniref:glutathione S-transferase n=1 Tax=Thiofilum flexile TaxID=125627 RepID=UPI000376994B|nr:glutathione S-transferase [Thiofilum flexile]